MFKSLAHRVKVSRIHPRFTLALLTLLALAGASPRLAASSLFFSGNLKSDATVTSCGNACTLDPADPDDGDYAQFAAVVDTFTVSSTSTMSAITYGYGGGISSTGHTVFAGGLEPYLSLFDSAGNFLASTYFGTNCPTGANTHNGNCYDVALDGGTLAAGTYQIALSAYFNFSLAENYGSGNLSDGFTGTGNLGAGESLDYAFDVILTPTSGPPPPPPPTVPEPGFLAPVGMAVAALFSHTRKKLRSA